MPAWLCHSPKMPRWMTLVLRAPCRHGNSVVPVRNRSISRAASRPSLMARSTSDCPLRQGVTRRQLGNGDRLLGNVKVDDVVGWKRRRACEVGQYFECRGRGVFTAVNCRHSFGIPPTTESGGTVATEHLADRARVSGLCDPPHFHVGIPCSSRPIRSSTSCVPSGVLARSSGVTPPSAALGCPSHSKAS